VARLRELHADELTQLTTTKKELEGAIETHAHRNDRKQQAMATEQKADRKARLVAEASQTAMQQELALLQQSEGDVRAETAQLQLQLERLERTEQERLAGGALTNSVKHRLEHEVAVLTMQLGAQADQLAACRAQLHAAEREAGAARSDLRRADDADNGLHHEARGLPPPPARGGPDAKPGTSRSTVLSPARAKSRLAAAVAESPAWEKLSRLEAAEQRMAALRRQRGQIVEDVAALRQGVVSSATARFASAPAPQQ
jgi:hypothetical protein